LVWLLARRCSDRGRQRTLSPARLAAHTNLFAWYRHRSRDLHSVRRHRRLVFTRCRTGLHSSRSSGDGDRRRLRLVVDVAAPPPRAAVRAHTATVRQMTMVQQERRLTFPVLALKTVVVHTVTYFVAGVLAYTLGGYGKTFT